MGQSFIVEGKQKLSGSIAVAGNKNEALPLIAASLLSAQKSTFTNVPNIGDVQGMLTIARALGAKASDIIDHQCTIDSSQEVSYELPLALAPHIRGSILFASALLVRTGQVHFPQPGGDRIGRRRIDTHLLVFEELGATITTERRQDQQGDEFRMYVITAPQGGLQGADIYLDEASVTATENAVIAAAGARGTTTITNAASEPHVQGLCHYLNSIGAHIEGIGSNILVVHGTDTFTETTHRVGCDYIEAGSFIALAACTKSTLTLTNVDTEVMRIILHQFQRLGVEVEVNREEQSLTISENQSMEIKKDHSGAIPHIADAPWPGFPADLTSIMLVTATQAKGTSLIHEKMFESRLYFTDNLISMGAEIILCDPHRAVVVGPANYYGARISSPDIRAGMALLIAALSAEGETKIQNIQQIDRGYEAIDTRLNALGAKIARTKPLSA